MPAVRQTIHSSYRPKLWSHFCKFSNGATTAAFANIYNKWEQAKTEIGEVAQCAWTCVKEQVGIETAAGAGMVVAGEGLVTKPGASIAAASGKVSPKTSLATKFFESIFGDMQWKWGDKIYRAWTPNRTRFNIYTPYVAKTLGRWTPWVGTGMLIYDGGQIVNCTYKCYSSESKRNR